MGCSGAHGASPASIPGANKKEGQRAWCAVGEWCGNAGPAVAVKSIDGHQKRSVLGSVHTHIYIPSPECTTVPIVQSPRARCKQTGWNANAIPVCATSVPSPSSELKKGKKPSFSSGVTQDFGLTRRGGQHKRTATPTSHTLIEYEHPSQDTFQPSQRNARSAARRHGKEYDHTSRMTSSSRIPRNTYISP
ncbi:hypothetical protein CC78DRAFT_578165 [Lojkania enalia]|uniref:Uncharacterized protein n=1 Tax=Lojkania enalia TaxID=147567 RepID=A0A9P4KHT8_9PLEO|nr:hypothetical protein CC78DRAFT_578165 [Didymosphaeria enalia]